MTLESAHKFIIFSFAFLLSFFAFSSIANAQSFQSDKTFIPYGEDPTVTFSWEIDSSQLPPEYYEFGGNIEISGQNCNSGQNVSSTDLSGSASMDINVWCGYGTYEIGLTGYIGGNPYSYESIDITIESPPPDPYTSYGQWGGGGATAGGIQSAVFGGPWPNNPTYYGYGYGYALTAIGYGSDDHRCKIGIKTAPWNWFDNTVDFSQTDTDWRYINCTAGEPEGDRVGYQKWFEPTNGFVATGWTWGADTSGGLGSGSGGSAYDNETPPDECFYQEYIDLNTKQPYGWGSQYDGTCNEEAYGDPDKLKNINRAPFGRVIVGIFFNTDDDAKLDLLAMSVRSKPPAPTVDFKVNNVEGPITVNVGDQVTLSWNTTTATYCNAYGGGFTGWRPPSGSESQTITAPITFTLECIGPSGSVYDTVIVYTPAPASTFTATSFDTRAGNGYDTVWPGGAGNDHTTGPMYVYYGQTFMFSWTSANTSACYIDGTQVSPASGGDYNPPYTLNSYGSGHTFTLTCSGPSGSVTKDLTVYLLPPPNSLSLSCPSGTQVNASWNLPSGFSQSYFRAGLGQDSWNADTSYIDGMNGSSQSFGTTPGSTYHVWVHTYYNGIWSQEIGANIECSNSDLKVNGLNGPIYVTLGSPVNLTWSSANATYCDASGGWSGIRFTSGSEWSGPITGSTTFNMTCYNGAGTSSFTDSVTVYVSNSTTDLQVNGNNGPAYIPYGSQVSLSWSSVNNTSCTASGGGWFGTKVTSGSELSPPVTSSPTTFTLNCSGPTGSSSDSVVVYIAATPTVDLKGNSSDGPVSIAYGAQVLMSWSSTDSINCYGYGNGWGDGTRSTSGSEWSPSVTVSPATFSMTCTGPGGTSTVDSVTVNIVPPPTVDIKTNGSDSSIFVVSGSTVTLSWTSTNATSCTASGGWSGGKSTSSTGETSPPITSATTFTLTCSGVGGSGSESMTVYVYIMPTQDLKINGGDGPVYVPYGSTITFSWTSTDAVFCTADNNGGYPWSGTKSTSGFEPTSWGIYSAVNFRLTCTGPAGTSPNDNVTVYILPDSATFVSQSVPTTMYAGYTYPVSITFRNTGTNSWSRCSPAYDMAPVSSYNWGQTSINLPIGACNSGQNIPLNSTATFSFNVTAPAPGTYNFQWQMRHSPTLFGDLSPNVSVFVPVPIAGICGSANKSYPQFTTSYGSDTYCASGSPSATPAFPAPGATVYWTCLGANGGGNSPQCSAYVPPNTAPLTVLKTNAQGGTVVSADSNIFCGGTCSYNYNIGSNVTLTAIPASALWQFAGWSGACTGLSPTCVVPIGSTATEVTAAFVARPFNYQEF